MEWYVIVLIVSSGVFLLTSVCLLLFGNMETDAGLDLDSGFTWGESVFVQGIDPFHHRFLADFDPDGRVYVSVVSVGVYHRRRFCAGVVLPV